MLKEIIIKTLWLATCQFFFREETDEAAVSSASHDFIGAPPTFSIWSYRFICFLNNRREKAGKREMKEEEEKEKEKEEEEEEEEEEEKEKEEKKRKRSGDETLLLDGKKRDVPQRGEGNRQGKRGRISGKNLP